MNCFHFLAARFQRGSERAFSLIDIHLSERCMRFENGEAREAITMHQPSTTKYLQAQEKPWCYFPNLWEIAAFLLPQYNGRNVGLIHFTSTVFVLSFFLSSASICFSLNSLCSAAKQLYQNLFVPSLPTLVFKQAGTQWGITWSEQEHLNSGMKKVYLDFKCLFRYTFYFEIVGFLSVFMPVFIVHSYSPVQHLEGLWLTCHPWTWNH